MLTPVSQSLLSGLGASFGRGLAWACVLLALAGCAGLPERSSIAVPVSTAIDAAASSSRLARIADDAVRGSGHASAFKPLPFGPAAYATLITLAAQAEHSLDLQTFEVHGDASGAGVLAALREAATRGVRVRILVDDLHTDAAESLLSDLAAFERIEVRLVNPFTRLRSSREAKLLSSLDEIERVNHRMHNKLFIADNALAVIGGRNIGDGYYMRSASGVNFLDLDLLAAGAVVPRMSASFDEYWNSEFAWPIDAIVPAAGDRAQRQARFDEAASHDASHATDWAVSPQRARAFGSAADELRLGVLRMTGADAEVVADPPDKLGGTRVGNRAGTVRATIGAAGLASRFEVFMVSPYYIPGRIGMESLRKNHRDGVRLRLITNSLAATDEPAVHAVYARYRRKLIELGMEIDELSPKLAAQELGAGHPPGSSVALHMKVIVFDRSSVFVGSLNLDGRSEQYNTEVGVMIRSPELTKLLLSLIDFQSSCYRVELDAEGQLRWLGPLDQVVYRSEPEAGAMRVLGARMLGLAVPPDWL